MKHNLQNLLILCLGLCMSTGILAQSRYFDERYIYTQAHLNPQLINPGAFGHSGGHQVLVNYRNKWAGIDGAPTTITLAYDGVVGNRLSAGVILLSDRFGAFTTSKAAAGLNYRIDGGDNKIGFGITGEYISHSLSNIGDADPNDPWITSGLAGKEYFDASIGMYGLYMDKFSYGLSFPSIVSTNINDIDGIAPEHKIGFILQAGYKLIVQNDITLTPSIIMKKLNNVPTHMDLNLNIGVLEDKLIGGMTYTLGGDKRLGFLLGTKLDKLRLIYSYNTSAQPIQSYNNGSHEFTLGVTFGKKAEMK